MHGRSVLPRIEHLKRKSTQATKTCGQESNPRADVAPTSGLNGSKSIPTYFSIANLAYSHASLSSISLSLSKKTSFTSSLSTITNNLNNKNNRKNSFPRVFFVKMHESRDPAIRLFGQKIPVPGDGDGDSFRVEDDESPRSMEIDKLEEDDVDADDDDELQNSDEHDDMVFIKFYNLIISCMWYL